MRYVFSPEFHRNLWLRFSPFRLVAAPVAIGLCFVAAPGVKAPGSNSLGPDWMQSLMSFALCWYVLAVVAWGTFEAATALQEEVRGNTWDFQRMSSISPLQLVLGKLFGATSFTWYFGLLALGVYAYGYHHYQAAPAQEPAGFGSLMIPRPQTPSGPQPSDDTLYVVLKLLLAGMLGQSLAFLHGFVDMTAFSSGTGRQRIPRGIGGFVMGGIAGLAATIIVTSSARHMQSLVDAIYRTDSELRWYGIGVSRDIFETCSLLFFLFWFLTGSYRLARTELMYRNTPFVWMAFVVSYIGWWCGLAWPGGSLARGEGIGHMLSGAFLQTVAICYTTMLLECSDGRKYARLAYYFAARDLKRALENTPKWLATVPIALVFMVAAILSPSNIERAPQLAVLFTSVLLFLLRDGCVVHSILQGIRGRGMGFAVLFYYLISYGMLPFAVYKMIDVDFGEVTEALRGTPVPEYMIAAATVFYPGAVAHPLAVLPVALEAAGAAAVLAALLRRSRKKLESS
jgi:hypothetical protein